MNLAENDLLRGWIVKRIKEVFGSNNSLIRDAEERGMLLTKSRLSKYLNAREGGLSEDQILWIATRLGIYINIGFGKAVFNKGKLKYEVTSYNELEALTRLKKIFKK